MLHYYNCLLIAQGFAKQKTPFDFLKKSKAGTSEKTEIEINAENLVDICNNNIVACILANPLSDEAAYKRALETCDKVIFK